MQAYPKELDCLKSDYFITYYNRFLAATKARIAHSVKDDETHFVGMINAHSDMLLLKIGYGTDSLQHLALKHLNYCLENQYTLYKTYRSFLDLKREYYNANPPEEPKVTYSEVKTTFRIGPFKLFEGSRQVPVEPTSVSMPLAHVKTIRNYIRFAVVELVYQKLLKEFKERTGYTHLQDAAFLNQLIEDLYHGRRHDQTKQWLQTLQPTKAPAQTKARDLPTAKVKRTKNDGITKLSQAQTAAFASYCARSGIILKDEYLNKSTLAKAIHTVTGYSDETLRKDLSKASHSLEDLKVLKQQLRQMLSMVDADINEQSTLKKVS